jgi:hypothetical protein
MTGPVLVLEFTGLGPQAHFDAIIETARLEPLVRVDPAAGQQGGARSIEEQAQLLRRQIGSAPRLILGHCSAASLALQVALACRPEASGADEPQVLLFDPVRSDLAELRAEFGQLAGRLNADPELAMQQLGNPSSGAAGATTCGERLMALREPLVLEYGGDQEAEDLVGQLLRRYLGWLRYLAAVIDGPPVHNRFPVSVLTSSAAEVDLAALVTDQSSVELHQVATTAGALLTDGWVVDYVGKAAERTTRR